MKPVQISVWLILLAVAGVSEQGSSGSNIPISAIPAETGTICVLPNSSEPPTRVSPSGNYNPATLTISIDKQTPVAWPHDQAMKIEKLNLSERHLIVLTSNGKRIQSFWFRFEKKDNHVCVAFDGYQGVQLRNSHGPFWCKCK